jgi:hypothetical protein
METGRPTVLMIITRPNMFLWGGLREPPWAPSNTIANILVQRGVGDPAHTIIAVFFVWGGGVNPMSPQQHNDKLSFEKGVDLLSKNDLPLCCWRHPTHPRAILL